jgi:putative signal transducing protein
MSSKSDDLVVVATFGDRTEAELAKGALDAAGIDAVVRSDDSGGLRPAMTFSNGAMLIVRAVDAEAARDILDIPATPA